MKSLFLVVPVVSRHQRLPRLWLDPVKWWAIGFSFQLAINQQSVCTSSAWLLPPGQGRPTQGRTCISTPRAANQLSYGLEIIEYTKKYTTPGVPEWSPTSVLTKPDLA